jgi:hypothetical protein
MNARSWKAESALAMLRESHGREGHALEQENLELYQDMYVLKREMVEARAIVRMEDAMFGMN